MTAIRPAELLGAVGFRYGNAGFSFLIGVMIARALDVGERGDLSYLQALFEVVLVGTSLGLPKVLLNLAVLGRTHRRATSIFLVVVLSAALAAAVVAAAIFWLKPEYAAYALPAALYCFSRSLTTIIDVRERGRFDFTAYYVYFGIERLVLIGLIGAALIVTFDVTAVLFCMALSNIVAVGAYLVRHPIAWSAPSKRQYGYIWRQMWKVGVTNTLASAVGVLTMRFDTFVIGELLDSEWLGYFAIAMLVINGINGLAGSLAFVGTAKLINKDRDGAGLPLYSWLGVGGAICVSYAIFWWLAPFAFPLIFGDKYAVSGDLFRASAVLGVLMAFKLMLQTKIVAENRFASLLAVNASLLAVKGIGIAILVGGDLVNVNNIIAVATVALALHIPLLIRLQRRFGIRTKPTGRLT
jgi:O-antigen/teichoic acid export membrane protein